MSNLPNGQDEVINSAAFVLKAFIDYVSEEIPGLKFVYDEEQSYETTISSYRAKNNLQDDPKDFYPMFSFKRSVLRHVDAGAGRRVASNLTRFNREDPPLNQPGLSDVYKVLHGSFDLDFMYITKSAKELERFEILYLTEEGISSKKELEVDLSHVVGGSLKYFVTYSRELSEKRFNSNDSYYKIVSGQATIKGFYPVFRTQSKHILQIYNKTLTDLGILLNEEIITT